MIRDVSALSAALLLAAASSAALASDDGERFAEGRVAYDKFHDCQAAYRALSAVSVAGQQEPMWIYYEAQTLDCLGRYDEALKYYRQYKNLIPPNPQLLDKIGEVAYRASQAANEKHAADELATRQAAARADISGNWQTHNSSQTVISLSETKNFIVKGTNSIEGYTYSGLYSEGNLNLTADDPGEWNQKALHACPDLTPADPVEYNLNVSQDGQSLSGTRVTTQVDFDSCDTHSEKSHVTWTRVP